MAHRLVVCHIFAYASGLLGVSLSFVLFYPIPISNEMRAIFLDVYFAEVPEADFIRVRVAFAATDRLCMLVLSDDYSFSLHVNFRTRRTRSLSTPYSCVITGECLYVAYGR